MTDQNTQSPDPTEPDMVASPGSIRGEQPGPGSGEMSPFRLFEIKLLEKYYLLIFISSVAALFLNLQTHWFYPLFPFVFFLLYKKAHQLYMDRMVAAFMVSPDSGNGMAGRLRTSAPAMVERLYAQKAGTEKIIFREMFQPPRNTAEKILHVFRFIASLSIGICCTWLAVLARLTVLKFLGIVAVLIILQTLIITLQSLWNIQYARKRWEQQFKESIESKPDLKSCILEQENIASSQIDDWIAMKIQGLIRNKINPDLITVESLLQRDPDR